MIFGDVRIFFSYGLCQSIVLVAHDQCIQREEDSQRMKAIIRLRDEKIQRLELLAENLQPAHEFLMEENIALRQEIQFLQAKIDRNPEVTRFALENIRLLEQLRM